MPNPSEKVSDILASIVVDQEYTVAKQNQDQDFDDFEAYIDLFDAVRSEKNYEWMSDIFLPEFTTHMLTQSAIDVDQYFATRDFIECYVQDPSDIAKASAAAAKECVNRTLNQRHLYHYPKFVRMKTLNHMVGYVWLECWWEQDTTTDTEIVYDEETGEETENIGETTVNIDRFNYEVHDPRNVFTDNKYVYSAQEKDMVIIRDEKTYLQLKDESVRHGYFNLDSLKEQKPSGDTETKKATREIDGPQQEFQDLTDKPFDRLRRFGKYWYKDGKPGIDDDGNVLPGATFEPCIITVVMSGTTKQTIGFNKIPYIANGKPYIPLIRGLCYIHPTQDSGVGDGKSTRELQVAINDTFNQSNDRVLFATTPTMKIKKYVAEDTDSIYWEPGHPIELEDPNDLVEMRVDDNVAGAMNQIAVLTQKFQEADAIYPTSMGQSPSKTTTATAIAAGEQNTTRRTNYKSMSFEYTALTELYWMILQMTGQFAQAETGVKLMGDKIVDFNPSLDYYYKPLSQSIETEQSKQAKIQRYTQLIGYVAQIPHPDIVKMINYYTMEIAKLMGDESENFAKNLLNPEQPIQQDNAGGGVPAETQVGAPSNQNGIAQSGLEQGTREAQDGRLGGLV